MKATEFYIREVGFFCLRAFLLPVLAAALLSCASSRRNVPVQTEELLIIEAATPPAPEALIEVESYPTAPAISRNAVYEELLDIVWTLREVKVNYGKMELDRAAMAVNGMGDVYTLQLTEEGVSGKAAPNRYFTTFELRHNHDFRLRPIIGTLLPANINIGGLMENEYYWYLQRASHWEIVNNELELYAYPSQNEEIVLRYRRQ
ncbi:MAG: META domain-containing protein [Spirochaetaceae bacterium]|jgi:hypothetical protein|nr:META domain-containing protein [Spirochaetaceae bacterium]